MMQVCTIVWPDIADHLGQTLQPVADDEEHVPHAAVTQIGEHAHPELRTLAAGAGPQPEDVALAVEADPDRGVDRPVGDLPIADLDHDRIDEDRRVDLAVSTGRCESWSEGIRDAQVCAEQGAGGGQAPLL
jgi:hypothetical protein